MADEILRALKAAGPAGITRTDISALFKRHESADRIGVALELLSRRSLAQTHHQPGLAGRPAEIWTATSCEKSELSEISPTSQGVLSHLSLLSQAEGG